MNEWNIQSRAHACQACAAPFQDRQPYHTLLFDQKAGYERVDVCEPCWASQYSQGATSRKGFISHWQGLFELPEVQPEPIQKENAESLLRRLIERADPRHGAACYILAVMLERKRILKVKEQLRSEGRRVFLYEQARTGDLFTIADPDLQLNQLESVQREVADLLEHGLPEPEAPQAPASPGATPQPDVAAGGPEPAVSGPVPEPTLAS